MSTTICLSASTLYSPKGGGHMWVYLNWALGFQSIGCRVIWLEGINPDTPVHELKEYVSALKDKLTPYGLANNVALRTPNGKPLPQELENVIDLDTAAEESDLLLNQRYNLSPQIISRFRRSALIDIDPGLLQMWFTRKLLNISPHDIYFTIGETVGQPGALFPDCGIHWHYTPPCVSLEWWPITPTLENAPLTTVTHWYSNFWEEEENGQFYSNDKKTGFLPFLELPRHTRTPLELTLLLFDFNEGEREELEALGWSVRDSQTIASTPLQYQQYIQQSLGEFSCVKPSCIRLQNAWISDRTICYLASGKPAIVQHTGASRFLPDDAGLLRFHTLEEAIRCLEKLATDYEKHRVLARSLAEEYFDARKVTASILERALT